MRRSFLLVAGFLLSAAVLLAALGWVARLALGLAASEAEARRRAAFEERVRLSLWRMDSALAAFLAEENARPVDSRDAGGTAPGLGPGAAPRSYVAARFEIDPASRVRESPASPRAEPRPAPARSQPGTIETLQAQAAPSPLAPPPPEVSAPDPKAAPKAQPKVLEPKVPEPKVQAKARDDPVAREMANQSLLNQAEFVQRANQSVAPGAPAAPSTESSTANSLARGPAAPASRGPAPPAASGVAPPVQSPAPSTVAGAPPPGQTSAPPAVPGPASPPAASAEPPRSSRAFAPLPAAPSRPHPASPARDPRERVLSALSPVWVGDDLVLARRVARGGAEHLQGLRLDGAGVRAWLAAQVRDLLPSAALLPLRSGETADPGRRLALLPLRLEPGPLPPPGEAGDGAPIRLGLGVASIAVLLAIAAAGLLLALSLRLARRRADFVSAVTHELRTPLTTFRLYTEMLAGGMVPDAERPSYLGTLRDEAGRLGHLVENVLAFARLERGRRRLAREDIELAALVGETAARLTPRAERDGLALEVDLPAEAAAVRVRADRLSVERILENLLDNACKYGRGAADPRLHLSVRLRDRRAVLTLRDHGPGVAGSRRRLFRPFHRSAADAAGSAPGIGLGLALSRRLARGFGGDLRLAHPPGGGAAFEILLPLAH